VPIGPSQELAFDPVALRRIDASVPAAIAAGAELVHDFAIGHVPIADSSVLDR
jgi:hypothetical protein